MLLMEWGLGVIAVHFSSVQFARIDVERPRWLAIAKETGQEACPTGGFRWREATASEKQGGPGGHQSVVVAYLQKIDTLVADPVHQAVLLRDTP